MDLNIVSIGRLKNNPLLEIQSDYKKRIIKLGKTIGINNLKINEGSVSKKNSSADIFFDSTKKNSDINKIVKILFFINSN